MSEPKRMHPIAAVLNTVRQIKDMIVPFGVFVIFGSNNFDLGYLVGALGVAILFLVAGVISWYRFTYRIEEGELRIEYGLFVKHKRYIPFERIQSLDYSEGILQRIFGLVKVTVETAGSTGGGKGDAELVAITKKEAGVIQEMLVRAKSQKTADAESLEETNGSVIYRMTGKELVLLATTSGGMGVILSAVFAFAFQLDEVIPYKKIFKDVSEYAAKGMAFIALAVFIVLFLAWAASVVATLVKYANYKVKKVGEDLVITRGLLEKRQFTIPLNRIQAVRIVENPLRQIFGLASASVHSAGGSAGNVESWKVLVLPVIKKDKIPALLEPYLEGYQLAPALKGLPRQSLRRYIFRGWIMAAPLVILALVFFKEWGLLSFLLFAISAPWSWLSFKDAGFCLEDDSLTLRARGFSRQTVMMKKKKVQSLTLVESPFQKKKELSTITAAVKSGAGASGGKVMDMDKDDAQSVYHWFSREES
ncbi:PH domain-containing protein [Bacillus massilinigeriensis]|uniref:PH domain-containing protein n=1 Tax=Bacillus mediterraneensis TaxID=1805474 RepID=UPI0008F921B1|nr:PH domain-containing protein [Bacillus mediterraneensis]